LFVHIPTNLLRHFVVARGLSSMQEVLDSNFIPFIVHKKDLPLEVEKGIGKEAKKYYNTKEGRIN
jgi:hypothetical protein